MKDVIQYSPIEVIASSNNGYASCDYEVGQIRTEEGEVVRYECCHCGFNPQDDQGLDISTPDGLLQWLEYRDMLIKEQD